MKSQSGKLTSKDISRLKENASGDDLYQAHKVAIKAQFLDTINNPENYGFQGQTADDLKEVASSSAHTAMSWKVTKNNIKEQLNHLSQDNVTELLLEDLMDAKVPVNNMYTFKAILKNPSDPSFNLEPEMIQYISTLDKDSKNSLLESLAKVKHLHTSDAVLFHGNQLQNFGAHLASAASSLWVQLEPVVMNLLSTLSRIGFAILTDIVSKNAGGDIGEAVKNAGNVVTDFLNKKEHKPDDFLTSSTIKDLTKDLSEDTAASHLIGDTTTSTADHH